MIYKQLLKTASCPLQQVVSLAAGYSNSGAENGTKYFGVSKEDTRWVIWSGAVRQAASRRVRLRVMPVNQRASKQRDKELARR